MNNRTLRVLNLPLFLTHQTRRNLTWRYSLCYSILALTCIMMLHIIVYILHLIYYTYRMLYCTSVKKIIHNFVNTSRCKKKYVYSKIHDAIKDRTQRDGKIKVCWRSILPERNNEFLCQFYSMLKRKIRTCCKEKKYWAMIWDDLISSRTKVQSQIIKAYKKVL